MGAYTQSAIRHITGIQFNQIQQIFIGPLAQHYTDQIAEIHIKPLHHCHFFTLPMAAASTL